jgi:hypothetical protein
MQEVKLSKEQVDAGELDNYDPARYDAEFHSDGSITLIPLRWWDDASYAAYQSSF